MKVSLVTPARRGGGISSLVSDKIISYSFSSLFMGVGL